MRQVFKITGWNLKNRFLAGGSSRSFTISPVVGLDDYLILHSNIVCPVEKKKSRGGKREEREKRAREKERKKSEEEKAQSRERRRSTRRRERERGREGRSPAHTHTHPENARLIKSTIFVTSSAVGHARMDFGDFPRTAKHVRRVVGRRHYCVHALGTTYR